jgi:hypothetical protein
MKVFPTMQTIEVIDNDIIIDGKLIDGFDEVTHTQCNGQDYLACFIDGLNVDCFKVEVSA